LRSPEESKKEEVGIKKFGEIRSKVEEVLDDIGSDEIVRTRRSRRENLAARFLLRRGLAKDSASGPGVEFKKNRCGMRLTT
jgi:hypothetical protein